MMMMWPLPDDGSFPTGPRRPHRADDPDVRLTYDVAEALTADDRLRRQRITVEVQNRVVLLSGTVDGGQTADAAVTIARSVAGVRDVCDGLRARAGTAAADLPETTRRTDLRAFEEIVADLAARDPSRNSADRTGSWPPGVVVALLMTVLGLMVGVLIVLAI